MKPAWDILKTLADQTRLRILNLLNQDELSVAELQEALGMAQSRISSQLAILRQNELVADRREGKKSFYSLSPRLPAHERSLLDAALNSVGDSQEIVEDQESLERVIAKRRRQAEEYFNLIAGRLGKNYCPGRSWEGIGHFLLYLVPEIRVADLGAGEGLISQLLARRAERVYCVDSSPRMVEVGTDLAKRNSLENLEYLLGDIEKVPLPDQSVHLALLSQALHHAIHPERAIQEAARILKPGGRLVVLDLKEHSFEKARELYADHWLGFAENQLHRWLKEAGLENVEVTSVSKEDEEPQFETLLASGIRP
ncbi:metalloregulator ArsR/SmtB family transcription factor [Pelagicoccus sp. SDUM812003]|uniref:ArsR/SmtB family transcription factor n=1 Tax=Pelagicoccus sp. SDUM812003 TaxID=3041267 RepID=UPI0028106E56|nr:metalloregulator ArsR/SmtB family transcription factor [Pelagicoccus sp. SDUM812003]MDQ8203019.1 metalloregulator ArsR/SmtB family transcription factor [Pelagicoccus sp. SDUM812003]